MAEVPQTDWNLIHRWEWFRRSDWQNGFRVRVVGDGGGPCRAFCDLCKLIGVDVALDASCGLGRRTICMNEMGVNLLGSDVSDEAVQHATELAAAENAPVHFFASAWRDLPQNAPHRFGAVFCHALHRLPTWEGLVAATGGLYHVLKPGGFLLFLGAPENAAADYIVKLQKEEWEADPRETVRWFHRDGATSCAQLVQKARGEDYIDERLLYVIAENGNPRLETTSLRRPGYWTWKHFCEITRTVGFCHLETRTYERYGPGGGPLKVNVAWKAKDSGSAPDAADRTAAYRM